MIIIDPPPDHPVYVKWWTGRLVSVRKMREEGTDPEFAAEPPAPAEEKPAEPPPKEWARRKKAG